MNKKIYDANNYQLDSARTLVDYPNFNITPHEIMLTWNVIGLAGEAGEVAELIKKGIFHKHGINTEELKKELGDCLWYL